MLQPTDHGLRLRLADHRGGLSGQVVLGFPFGEDPAGHTQRLALTTQRPEPQRGLYRLDPSCRYL